MDEMEITKNLFDKKLICPVCGTAFTQKCVKAKTPRILSKDSDFFVRYKTINPYFYDVWICNMCGYSALKSDFEKIRSYEKEIIYKNITTSWKPLQFPVVLDANDAIDRFNLALNTATILNKHASVKASIFLKISWMYRLLEDTDNEQIYLSCAIDNFVDAYQNEVFPICGMQRDMFCFLVGELNRRIGQYDDALKWLSKVIENTNSSSIVRKYTFDTKEQIKEEMSQA